MRIDWLADFFFFRKRSIELLLAFSYGAILGHAHCDSTVRTSVEMRVTLKPKLCSHAARDECGASKYMRDLPCFDSLRG